MSWQDHPDGWEYQDAWTDDDMDLSELSPEEWPAWAQDAYLPPIHAEQASPPACLFPPATTGR